MNLKQQADSVDQSYKNFVVVNINNHCMRLAVMQGVSLASASELDLVDVEGVRFLNACEAKGISVLHCSPYIREWMLRERSRPERKDA